MTTPLRQFILKRGNTAVSSTYTGPAGEITYDTGLNAVRIHDGITPGGNLMPSSTGYETLISNVSVLQANVNTLFANAAVQAIYISTLQSNVATLSNLTSSSGPTPPINAATGALWYDSTDGRLYVNYSDFWVDASPETVYTLPTATANTLGGVKIGGNLTIIDGVLSATSNLGNLRISDQTISGTIVDRDITLAPAGAGTVQVPSLTLPNASLTGTTDAIEVIIADLILDTVVDYSTGDGDTLAIGTIGNPVGIAHPWAIYRFTTTPSPVLQIDDVIGGAGVPVNSKIVYVGTDAYSAYVVTNKVFPLGVPANGITITTVRPVVNASISITTAANTDIVLNTSGSLSSVITHSDFVPVSDNTFDLGTPTKRFQQLWLGGGTIFIADPVLGIDLSIAALNGDLVVQGGAGLEVGEFIFRNNQLFLTNPATEIIIGTTGATAPVTFKRTIQVRNSTDEYDLLEVDQQGRVTVLSDIATDPTEAAMSIVGARTRDIQSPNNLGVLLQLTGSSTAPSRIYHDSYGAANYSAFVGRHARGNSLVATQTLSGDIISRVGANPHDGTSFATISTMRMDFVNAEDQTISARGSKLEFWTTPIGSTTIGKRVTIDGSDIVLTAAGAGGITFADSSRQTTAWLGDTSLNAVNANITAANVNIATLFANAAVQSEDITTLFANAATQQTTINTLAANAAAQQSDISALTANAATQQTQINAITANAVTAVTAGTGISVSRVNGIVGINNTGVTTVAGTANRILVNGGTTAANAAITLNLPQDIAPSSTVTFANLTITGNLSIEGNIIASENISLESKILYLANSATSGSELDGGGIILGNVNAPFSRSILYDFNANAWNTNGAGLVTLDLNADSAYVDYLWNNGGAHFGGAYDDYDFPNAIIQSDSDANSYVQQILRNHNSGTNASTDYVAVNDIGDDSSYYIDLGINSSSYNNPDYSINGANGGYLYINGGNLSIGTQTAGNVIKFHTSGTTESNLRVTIDDNGLSSVGNVSATYFVGSGQYITGLYSNANAAAYLTTDSNIIAIWANITSINSAWQSNAGTQQTEINALGANITAANAAIVTANSAVVSYVNTLNTAMTANITAVNLQIANTSVTVFANAASQQLEINSLRANITAANVNIAALQSNTATAANNINILFANAAAQESSIGALRANITAANSAIVTANTGMKNYVDTVTSNWTANAASQQTEINALRANITAANSAIVTANSAVVSYVNTLNSAMTANVTAANSAIVTANTGMKSYVDAQFSSGVTSLTGGNNIVLSGSTGGVTIQRVDGLQSIITGNIASSYTLTTTNQYFGTTRSATGTGTVTLPLGSTVPVGRQYIIKDEGGQSGYSLRRITIAASGSDTIDGSASRGITSNYGSITVLWTGTRWSVI